METESSSSKLPDGLDWEALARYEAGECNPIEAEQVRRWLADHPEYGEPLSMLHSAIGRLQGTSDVDVAAALRAVKARAEGTATDVRSIAAPQPRWTVRHFAIAAGLVIAATGLALRYAVKSSRETSVPALRLAAAQNYITDVGARDSIRLSDGTQVTLAPGSSLSLSAGYGQTHRTVSLRGEAFFVAAHDTTRPFTVRADGALVRDIGTAFNVRADGSGTVRVTVATGAVVLRAASDTGTAVTLTTNDVGLVEIEPGAAAHVSRQQASTSAANWKPGQLVLDGAPMTEVHDVLRRWYGIDVTFDGIVSRRHVTVTFTNESAAQAVDVIAKTIGATADWRTDRGQGAVVLHDALAPARSR